MLPKTSGHVLVTAALAAALVGSWVWPLAGQADEKPAAPAAPMPAPDGARAAGAAAGQRYHIIAVPREMNPYVAVIDTRTGRTWTALVGGGKWNDLGVPPGAQAD